MKIYKKSLSRIKSEFILISIVFLFFFQLISDFVESVYAVNLIGTEVNESITAVLFLLAPILLVILPFKKGFPNKLFLIIGEIIVISRIMEPFFGIYLRIIITGIGVGCFMLFLPMFLKRINYHDHEKYSMILGTSLAFGLAASILLRTIGSSIDLSTYSWFQLIGWIPAVIATIIIVNLLKSTQAETMNSNQSGNVASTSFSSEKTITKPPNKWKIIGLSVGMTSVLVLAYYVFSSPTVISRWTEGNYFAIVSMLIVMITLFVLIALYKPEIIGKLKPKGILIWNILFVVTLILTIVTNQIAFAFVPSYPYYAPETTIFHDCVLYIMLALSPIILIDFTLLSREMIKSRPNLRKIGGSFFLSSCFFVCLIFANVFTIAWDYIPLIGPLFRDMIWLIFLIIGIFLILPVLLLREHTLLFKKLEFKLDIKKWIRYGIVLICVGTIVSAFILELPITHPNPTLSIKILSYNIQQGVDENANENFEGQFQVISQYDADIIGLQESDTCRLSGGNFDMVRFVSNRLKLYSYYGPKTVTGTFGIALLSKYPISNARTFYMTSKGEQTATIQAQITIRDKTYNIFVTHLGNYKDPSVDRSQIIQQEEILQRIAGLTDVILMGDFNFKPNTEQYEITTNVLYDCWVVATGSFIETVPKNWETRLPNGRIDHVFVSSSLKSKVVYCIYTGGSASDHPALLTVLEI